jgi:cytochrome P450
VAVQQSAGEWPAGARVTRAGLTRDPYPLLAGLRASEPVSWLPALGGWLVTRWDLAVAVLRDDETFTVDDPRFSTARVVGPSMLSRDGAEHGRHRGAFTTGFSRAVVTARLAGFTETEAERLVLALRPDGRGDLRTGLAGPLAVAVMARALGLGDVDTGTVLDWYREIVAAVTALAGQVEPGTAGPDVPASGDAAALAGEAFGLLATTLRRSIAEPTGTCLLAGVAAEGGLVPGEAVSNAAVVMFGGIETTEGMITNTLFHLLTDPAQLRLVRADPALIPAAVEESLRLEPAAAMVDRYATRDTVVAGAHIRAGDLVSVSIGAAGRDPAVFPRPDVFDVRRLNARRHLAFAQGPHFCLGVHLARLEAQCAVSAALRLLPGLRLERDPAAPPEGLVFRKPPALPVLWDAGGR